MKPSQAIRKHRYPVSNTKPDNTPTPKQIQQGLKRRWVEDHQAMMRDKRGELM